MLVQIPKFRSGTQLFFVLLGLLGLALLPAEAHGRYWHVSSASGNDEGKGSATEKLKTIQRAYQEAAAGDTILLDSGVYSEPLRLQRKFEVPVTIRAASAIPGDVIVEGLRKRGVVLEGASQLVFQGIHFRSNQDQNLAPLVLVGDVSSIKFQNCIFTTRSSSLETRYGVTARLRPGSAIHSITFDHCTFRQLGSGPVEGLSLLPRETNAVRDIIVTGCRFLNTRFNIRFQGVVGAVIERNTLETLGARAVGNLLLGANTVRGDTSLPSSGNIAENLIRAASGYGVFIGAGTESQGNASPSVHLRNNLIQGASTPEGHSLVLRGARGVHILQNTIRSGGRSAIYLKGAGDVVVRENVIEASSGVEFAAALRIAGDYLASARNSAATISRNVFNVSSGQVMAIDDSSYHRFDELAMDKNIYRVSLAATWGQIGGSAIANLRNLRFIWRNSGGNAANDHFSIHDDSNMLSLQTAAPEPSRRLPTKTLYVSSQGDDKNDGLREATSLRTLKAALARSRGGEKILVADGVYREPLVINQRFDVPVVVAAAAEAPGGVVFSPVLIAGAKNIIFKDLTFWAASGENAAVEFVARGQASSEIAFERCKFVAYASLGVDEARTRFSVFGGDTVAGRLSFKACDFTQYPYPSKEERWGARVDGLSLVQLRDSSSTIESLTLTDSRFETTRKCADLSSVKQVWLEGNAMLSHGVYGGGTCLTLGVDDSILNRNPISSVGVIQHNTVVTRSGHAFLLGAGAGGVALSAQPGIHAAGNTVVGGHLSVSSGNWREQHEFLMRTGQGLVLKEAKNFFARNNVVVAGYLNTLYIKGAQAGSLLGNIVISNQPFATALRLGLDTQTGGLAFADIRAKYNLVEVAVSPELRDLGLGNICDRVPAIFYYGYRSQRQDGVKMCEEEPTSRSMIDENVYILGRDGTFGRIVNKPITGDEPALPAMLRQAWLGSPNDPCAKPRYNDARSVVTTIEE